MMRTLAGLLMVWGLGVGLPATCAAAAEPGLTVWVSPAGDDGGDGSAEKPFATLARARDALRPLRSATQPAAPATVYLRGGTYYLDKTFELEARDGGTKDAPVVYCAAPGEKPVLSGGKAITGFTPYKGSILQADANAQGFKGVYFRQLFLDGKRQILARYPNFDPANPWAGGWAYVAGKISPLYATLPDDDKRLLHAKNGDFHSWANPTEGEVFLFPRYNWWNDNRRIASVDAEKKTLTLVSDASYAIRGGDRYYVQSLLEELDTPGEWHLDKKSDTLYYWPPEGGLRGKALVAPVLSTIVKAKGVSHLTLRGLTFECSATVGVSLENCTACLVAGNVLRNIGGMGGSAVSVRGGLHNGVAGNDIYEMGRNCIDLSGGDVATLTPAGNYADNNYLHHFGIYYKQGVGVSLTGVGNRASHNLIHDGPRFGVLFHGQNLVIEYNHMRHLCLETEDTGAVYTGGRDWLGSRGTVIRYNYFHDIIGFGRDAKGNWLSPYFCWGVYLDDNTGGVDVVGNVVVGCYRAGIHLHNGRDNLVENNVLVDNGLQQYECNGWTLTHRMWKEHYETMVQGFESVAGQPAWKAMRGMDVHPSKVADAQGRTMTGDRFLRNIVYYRGASSKLFRLSNVALGKYESDYNVVWHEGGALDFARGAGKDDPQNWKQWQAKGFDKHSLVADPLFVDAAKGDYRLRPDSPALKLGIKSIPMEKVGPYADPLRASWPIVEAPGERERLKGRQ